MKISFQSLVANIREGTLMDFKQRLAWERDTLLFATEVARDRAVTWLAKLPRPFKQATDEKLVNLAGKSLAGGVAYGISLKTVKVLSPSLVDRRLTTVGKVAFGVGLAAYGVVGLLAAHELYIRAELKAMERREEDYDEIIRLLGL